MCQVLAGVAVVGLHAWRFSLLPDAGVVTHMPELALLALAISVAIGLAGSWGPGEAAPGASFARLFATCRRAGSGRRLVEIKTGQAHAGAAVQQVHRETPARSRA